MYVVVVHGAGFSDKLRRSQLLSAQSAAPAFTLFFFLLMRENVVCTCSLTQEKRLICCRQFGYPAFLQAAVIAAAAAACI